MSYILQKGDKDFNIDFLYQFQDGRIHAKFFDKSSIIINKGHQCCTYFSKKAEKRRFFIGSIPATEQCEQKIANALRVANSLNDIPIINMENIYPKQNLEYNQNKLSSCIWSQEEKYIQQNPKNNDISIQSTDGHAKLILHANKLVFTIEYKQLIPVKKPKSSKETDNDFEDQSNNKNQDFDFTKNFLKKYNIPQRQNKDLKVKLNYTYFKMKKLFSIYSFPSRWAVPLFLVWRFYISSFSNNESIIKPPQFQQDLIEYIEYDQIQNTQHQQDTHISLNTSHNNTLTQQQNQSQSILNQNPFNDYEQQQNEKLIEEIGKKYNSFKINNEYITELPSIGIEQYLPKCENINSENIWSYDVTAPNPTYPKYDNAVEYFWSANIISWFDIKSNPEIQNKCEILSYNLNENSFIYSKKQGKFLHKLDSNILNQNETQEDKEKIYYDIQHIPKDSIQSDFQEFYEVLQSVTCVRQFNEQFLGTEFYANEKLQNLKDQHIEQNIAYYSDNFESIKVIQTEDGKFEAFKNGHVKVIFSDRTICKMAKNQDYASIISRFGQECQVYFNDPKEFGYYVDKTYEFFDYIFTDPKERLAKLEREEQLNQQIQHELEKNERFLSIVNNKIPQRYTEQKENNNNNNFPDLNQSISNIEQQSIYSSERSFFRDNETVQSEQQSNISYLQNQHNYNHLHYDYSINQNQLDNYAGQNDQNISNIQQIMEQNEKMMKEIQNLIV